MHYLAGIGGVGLIAYAVFGMEFVFPSWKRWAVAAVGATLALAAILTRPASQGSAAPQDCYKVGLAEVCE